MASYVNHRHADVLFSQDKRMRSSNKRLKVVSAQQEDKKAILDQFWQLRGVASESQREHLIGCGLNSANQGNELSWENDKGLPGAGIFWQLQWDNSAEKQVRALSQRLLELHVLLGSRDDIDIAWMMTNCPGLLQATMENLSERLMAMKATPGAEILDIAKIVESHPSLLLIETSQDESLDAWTYGLTNSSSQEWSSRIALLEKYRLDNGDLHIGIRPDDPPDLQKLARMLRQDFRKGILPHERALFLRNLGFEFDAETAEWQVMYKQLQNLHQAGSKDANLLAGNFDFLLNNWCSVQRISNRAGVLDQGKKLQLDEIGFDWTGADALS